MIFARPPATSFATSTSLTFSGSVSVLVSPVVPVTTMPSAPWVTTWSTCFSTSDQSTSPSAVNGVTSATSTCPKGFSGVDTIYRLAGSPDGTRAPVAADRCGPRVSSSIREEHRHGDHSAPAAGGSVPIRFHHGDRRAARPRPLVRDRLAGPGAHAHLPAAARLPRPPADREQARASWGLEGRRAAH